MKWSVKFYSLIPIENLWKIIEDLAKEHKLSSVTDSWVKLKDDWKKTLDLYKKFTLCLDMYAEVIACVL